MHQQCTWTLSKQLPKIVLYHLVFDENQVILICRPHRLYRGQIRAMYWINCEIQERCIMGFVRLPYSHACQLFVHMLVQRTIFCLFMQGIHYWLVYTMQKGPVMQKIFQCLDVPMLHHGDVVAMVILKMMGNPCLTHWGRVTHICVSKLTIIGSDNSLSPDRRQAIIWTNAGLLLIEPLGTNISEILIKILTFSFKTWPTLNAYKPSATLDPYIPTWSIMSPNNHLSFSKSYMLSIHEAITILYSYHLPCQGSRNCQKSDVSNHLFVDMVRSLFQYCPSI